MAAGESARQLARRLGRSPSTDRAADSIEQLSVSFPDT
ncbi:helix-turn-helix domain-containing protein [Streptomyces sp. NPDC007896]